MREKTILLNVLVLSILFLGSSAFSTAQDGDSEAKIFHIDDTFKIGWTDGVDNYEAHYKVWKIEEQQDENITIFTLVSGGGIAFHSLDRHFISLGSTGKLIINEIYVSEEDRWISISLENAEFKEESASTPPSSGDSGSGGSSAGGSCSEYYSCRDGSEVQYCETVRTEIPSTCTGTPPSCTAGSFSVGCVCNKDPESLCPKIETTTETYFKNCNYIWDSSPYIGQNVKITASVIDTSGSVDIVSIYLNVLESVSGGTGGAYPMDGKTLDIQIIGSGSGDVAGAVEIKINSKSPTELGEMFLGLSGEGWGTGFPISNRNCVTGGSGGDDSSRVSSCEKYHVCEDGSEIQYCEIIKQYDDDGNIVGAGCTCKQTPEEVCTSLSSGGRGGYEVGESAEISSLGGGGGSRSNNETPIICSGCILGDKCAPVGYRTNDKYCTIDREIIDQKESEDSCNNNFECSANLCIDSQCISSGVWQKILRWFSGLFG